MTSLSYQAACPPDTQQRKKDELTRFFDLKKKKVQSFEFFNQGTLLTGGHMDFPFGISMFLFIYVKTFSKPQKLFKNKEQLLVLLSPVLVPSGNVDVKIGF